MKQSDQDQIDSVAFHKAFGHLLPRPAARQSEFDMDTSSCEDATNLEKAMTAKAAKKPVSKTMCSVNDIQLTRLDKLVISFKKRDKKLLYVDGMLQNDDSQKVWFYGLKRTDDKAAKIVRKPEKRSMDSDRSYPRALTTEFAAAVDEHSVLDLFRTACKMLPGFEAASARRLNKRATQFTPKKAVAPFPYDGTEAPFQFDQPLLERSQIRPSRFGNALGLGSTGSGKTASFIQPVLFSMLAYRLAGGKTMSLLVIDPKVELLSAIEARLAAQGESERLVVVGACDPINYFDEDDGLSVADRFEKVKSLVAVTSTTGDDNRWAVFAEQLVVGFLTDDQAFADASRLPLLEAVAAIVMGDPKYLDRNQFVAMRKLLLLGLEDPSKLRHISDVYDLLTMAVGLTNMNRPFARYCTLKDGDQYFYNTRGILSIIEKFASPDIEPILDLSVRRGLNKQGIRTDVAALINRGAVLVFQPRQTATHDLAGRALKTLFFRCVVERQDMERPIAYVADEFQRFYSCDPDSGDYASLDRCRAYRVNCVLATQSISALMAITNHGPSSRSLLDSLLTNTTTKLCFRTNEESSIAIMKTFIPRDPHSDQHVLSFRPPSSLLVGEYYFCVQHEWGRTRYQLPAQAAERQVGSKN
jgi:hypothetical protein